MVKDWVALALMTWAGNVCEMSCLVELKAGSLGDEVSGTSLFLEEKTRTISKIPSDLL